MQLETELPRQADRVLLLDADILFLRDPRPLFDDNAVRAKIVDCPADLKRRAGRFMHQAVFKPATAFPSSHPIRRPPARNGGVYFCRGNFARVSRNVAALVAILPAADQLLGEQLQTFGPVLGFALAMHELDPAFRPLTLATTSRRILRVTAYDRVSPQN